MLTCVCVCHSLDVACSLPLSTAAGVSAVGDKRRKPWNSMAIPDLRRCWELLLSCGLVSPALAKDVNATTGKVYLTALVEPIARSALEDGALPISHRRV